MAGEGTPMVLDVILNQRRRSCNSSEPSLPASEASYCPIAGVGSARVPVRESVTHSG